MNYDVEKFLEGSGAGLMEVPFRRIRGRTEDDDETSSVASFLASVRSLHFSNASRKR